MQSKGKPRANQTPSLRAQRSNLIVQRATLRGWRLLRCACNDGVSNELPMHERNIHGHFQAKMAEKAHETCA
jgi:hypothetical protein